MKKLFKNKKGFTLMEMLIVVAIIVILVAVSMPVFTSQLEKSRKAADDANMRAAKAVAVAEYLMNETEGQYVYDAATGKLDAFSNRGNVVRYGKNTDGIIEVNIDAEGNVDLKWVPTGKQPQ